MAKAWARFWLRLAFICIFIAVFGDSSKVKITKSVEEAK